MDLLKADHRQRWQAYLEAEGSTSKAAALAKVNYNTYRTWLKSFKIEHGPDGPPEEYWLTPDPEPEPPKPKDPPDVLKMHRLEEANKHLKKTVNDLKRRAVEAEDRLEAVIDLNPQRFVPVSVLKATGARKGGQRSAILHISDVHDGEVVDLYEMDGLNSYNPDICAARLQRLFQKTVNLLTYHWAGDPVERIVVVLGGDMIDGHLRPEALRGGSWPVVPSVQHVSEHLAGGLKFLSSEVDAQIDVLTTPGNHSRLTEKPHINQHAIDSLDVMVSWAIEKMLADREKINFYYTGSGEALFNVYGWRFLAQHGHMGAGGSGGVYGPVYKQVRGMYRAHQSYARRRRGFDWVLQGHDHTTSKITFGISNGSVVGYNPFAAHKLKADPEPAKQNLIIVEKTHGIINLMELYLGVPEEGDLYVPPPEPELRDGKPLVRVPATYRTLPSEG